MTSEDLFLPRFGCEQLWSVLSILSVVPFGLRKNRRDLVLKLERLLLKPFEDLVGSFQKAAACSIARFSLDILGLDPHYTLRNCARAAPALVTKVRALGQAIHEPPTAPGLPITSPFRIRPLI